ncbi:MAG: TetR/AcrR family transcriptional regulator [Clostridia bacterium]|nr:TetR/AcrR family transcriptional regulator [Clostridia bacterium]
MQTVISTKERILDAALTLFSEKGYDGVGVDLIAANAGLKGPSIYKHFKGKEEILETVIEQINRHYEAGFRRNPAVLPASVDELVAISMERIRFTLNDPLIVKARKLLTLEQFRSPFFAAQATAHNYENIQTMYANMFAGMMEAGTLRREDPQWLAMLFLSPVTLLIQMHDREPARREEAVQRIEEHLRHFADVYGIRKAP